MVHWQEVKEHLVEADIFNYLTEKNYRYLQKYGINLTGPYLYRYRYLYVKTSAVG